MFSPGISPTLVTEQTSAMKWRSAGPKPAAWSAPAAPAAPAAPRAAARHHVSSGSASTAARQSLSRRSTSVALCSVRMAPSMALRWLLRLIRRKSHPRTVESNTRAAASDRSSCAQGTSSKHL